MSGASQIEVAQAAGVSRAAVSQILSGRGQRFSEATRARVQRVALELAYEPSAAGRTLRRGTSDVVVAIVPNTTFGPHLQDILDDLTADLAEDGLFVVARYSPSGDDSFGRFIGAARPAAVVPLAALSEEHLEILAARGARLTPAVQSDPGDGQEAVVQAQVQHLTDRGHRQLAYAHLSDKREDAYGRGRAENVVRICRDRGLPTPETLTVPLDVGAAVEQLKGLRAATAVACYNDDVALAVLAAARVLGRRVPGDLAVIGMDHTPVGRLVDPRLTTIGYDASAVAFSLGDAVRASLGLPLRHVGVNLAFFLVQGGTT